MCVQMYMYACVCMHVCFRVCADVCEVRDLHFHIPFEAYLSQCLIMNLVHKLEWLVSFDGSQLTVWGKARNLLANFSLQQYHAPTSIQLIKVGGVNYLVNFRLQRKHMNLLSLLLSPGKPAILTKL